MTQLTFEVYENLILLRHSYSYVGSSWRMDNGSPPSVGATGWVMS
jgi:hypothetical protein